MNGRTLMQVAAVLLTLNLLACEGPSAPASQRPPESGVIQARLERIDSVMIDAIARNDIPGAVALVSHKGAVVYERAFGLADIASGKPMQTDTIFRIASMTKAVTSVAVMQLYEQGHFQLNDEVDRYLPEFAEMSIIVESAEDGSVTTTRPATKKIRIIDLLTHSSGISYAFIDGKHKAAYLAAGVIDGLTVSDRLLADQVKLLASMPLLHEPGEKFSYGLNTDVLGRLIEVVSGQSLDQYFVKNITQPLGMQDTAFYLPDDKRDRLATLYAYVESDELRVSDGTESSIKLDNPNYPIEGAKTYFSGGAGLSSTAADYARFLQMLLNDGELGGVRIISRKSVELMRTARIDWDDDGKADFGLGFAVIGDLGRYGELGTEGSYGWGGAFHTQFFIDPQEQLVAVFMSQLRPARPGATAGFNTAIYQALK